VVAVADGIASVSQDLFCNFNVRVGPLVLPSVQVQEGLAKLGVPDEFGLRICP
jgi:hypothetical protein